MGSGGFNIKSTDCTGGEVVTLASPKALNMKEKLDNVIKFENNSLPIEANETAFVRVSFKVNELGKIEVLASNYSDENIKQQLMEKLNEITVDNKHDVDEVYYYNFIFKKM